MSNIITDSETYILKEKLKMENHLHVLQSNISLESLTNIETYNLHKTTLPLTKENQYKLRIEKQNLFKDHNVVKYFKYKTKYLMFLKKISYNIKEVFN
jgi:hypothetical protein